MGATMFRILLAGSDSRLLATRAAVLSRTGAAVVYGNPMETLDTLDRGETFDLVVLCHTLEDSDVMAIVDKAHEKITRVKILMVTSELEGYRVHVNNKIDATTMPEPAHLVALAKEMLQAAAYPSPVSVWMRRAEVGVGTAANGTTERQMSLATHARK
jgi:DNA-binding response OmpR family regulator